MPLSNVAASVDWGYFPLAILVSMRGSATLKLPAFVDVPMSMASPSLSTSCTAYGVDFPYFDAYTRLQYRDNPFMGPFAKDYFSNFGKSTDFNRPSHPRLLFHRQSSLAGRLSRRRIPLRLRAELLGRPTGVGYANLVYETYQLAKQQIAASAPYWSFRRRPRSRLD